MSKINEWSDPLREEKYPARIDASIEVSSPEHLDGLVIGAFVSFCAQDFPSLMIAMTLFSEYRHLEIARVLLSSYEGDEYDSVGPALASAAENLDFGGQGVAAETILKTYDPPRVFSGSVTLSADALLAQKSEVSEKLLFSVTAPSLFTAALSVHIALSPDNRENLGLRVANDFND